jgi:hypothetical protein
MYSKPAPTQWPGTCKFKVGDRVRLLHGLTGVVGEVVEDRSNLGVGGERIHGVRIQMDQWNERTSEFPESSLEAAPE